MTFGVVVLFPHPFQLGATSMVDGVRWRGSVVDKNKGMTNVSSSTLRASHALTGAAVAPNGDLVGQQQEQ